MNCEFNDKITSLYNDEFIEKIIFSITSFSNYYVNVIRKLTNDNTYTIENLYGFIDQIFNNMDKKYICENIIKMYAFITSVFDIVGNLEFLTSEGPKTSLSSTLNEFWATILKESFMKQLNADDYKCQYFVFLRKYFKDTLKIAEINSDDKTIYAKIIGFNSNGVSFNIAFNRYDRGELISCKFNNLTDDNTLNKENIFKGVYNSIGNDNFDDDLPDLSDSDYIDYSDDVELSDGDYIDYSDDDVYVNSSDGF